MAKSWYTSKTILVNAAMLLCTVLALPEVTGLLPDEALRFVVALQAVVNVVLRFATTTAVRNPVGHAVPDGL